VGGKGGDRGKGEEMTQTLYAHISKRKKKEDRPMQLVCRYRDNSEEY
jgi:hypothetical protein